MLTNPSWQTSCNSLLKSNRAATTGSNVRRGSAATAGRAESTGGARRVWQPWRTARNVLGFKLSWKQTENRGGYLEKLNVVLHGGKLVQFRLVLFQLGDLCPHLFQELLGQIDGPLFLGFHQFSHLKALHLNRPDQFRKDGVAILGGRTSRTLERAKGGKIRRVSMSWSLWTAKHQTKEQLKSSQERRPSCGLFCV